MHQRARQRHALTLAARQHRRPVVGAVGQAHLRRARRGARAMRVRTRRPSATLSSTRCHGSSRASWNMMRTSARCRDRLAVERDAPRWRARARPAAAAACSCRSRCGRRRRRTRPASMRRSMPSSTGARRSAWPAPASMPGSRSSAAPRRPPVVSCARQWRTCRAARGAGGSAAPSISLMYMTSLAVYGGVMRCALVARMPAQPPALQAARPARRPACRAAA